MLGAIIGDIVGSRFEWNNHRDKDFEFLTYKCFPTDDSIMSLAIAQAILVSKPNHSDLSKNAIECMQNVGRNYPDCGYGGSFYNWMFSDNPKPYNSYGNGAAMRVSPAGFAATSLEEAKELALCIGLNLKPEYCYSLIEKAGYSLKATEEHMVYRFLIDNHTDENLESWNKTLADFGIEQKLPDNRKRDN